MRVSINQHRIGYVTVTPCNQVWRNKVAKWAQQNGSNNHDGTLFFQSLEEFLEVNIYLGYLSDSEIRDLEYGWSLEKNGIDKWDYLTMLGYDANNQKELLK